MRLSFGLFALCGVWSVSLARPAGYFGFGPPPAYLDLTHSLRAALRLRESDSLEISQPVIGCMNRGIGKRDVCGYRFCLRAVGTARAVSEMWLIRGYGLNPNPSGSCTASFKEWRGDPPVEVADFCTYQPQHDDCKDGRKEGLVKLSVEASTGSAELARQAAELARQAGQAQAAEDARIAKIKSAGPVKAYSSLATLRYRSCQDLANSFLQTEIKDTQKLFEFGLEAIRTCSAKQEAFLNDEIREALARSPPSAAQPLKDLHAYTIASLRALTNYHQSVIEARESRAQRMAGIDERTTRVELELPAQ